MMVAPQVALALAVAEEGVVVLVTLVVKLMIVQADHLILATAAPA
jgi:hypothetical protein